MEIIVPTKYIQNEDTEIVSFPGVAYKTKDGVKTEVIWGTHPNVSVALTDRRTDTEVFIITHVFVERYIQIYVKQDIMDVEIFKFHINKGDFPEKPDSHRGEVIANFIDSKLNNVWMSFEHISGPYIADISYLTDAMKNKRLEEIGAKILIDLVPDRDIYINNPEDLPQIDIIMNGKEEDSNYDYIRNLIEKDKVIKQWIN